MRGDSLKIEVYAENWYALVVCLINGASSEAAIARMGLRERERDGGGEGEGEGQSGVVLSTEERMAVREAQRKREMDAVTEEMARLRGEGMPFKVIGAMFGVTADTVYRRIKRRREARETLKKGEGIKDESRGS